MSQEPQLEPTESVDKLKNISAPESGKKLQNNADDTRNGLLGLAAIVFGNIASIAGSIEKVNEQVQKIQGQLHLGTTPYLLYILMGIIFVGYALTSKSIYKYLKSIRKLKFPGMKLALGLLVFAFMGTLYAFNIVAIPPAGSVILPSRRDIWLTKVRDTHQSNGGFSIMLWSGPSNPTQIFTTAQGLAAMVSAMDWEKAEQRNIEVIRAGFDYIDSKRDPIEGGWGYFEGSQPLTEIAGWVTVARTRALEHGDQIWPLDSDRQKQLNFVQHDLTHIMSHYVKSENAWSPFLPLNTSSTNARPCSAIPNALLGLSTEPPARTYSTLMALWALLEAHRVESVRLKIGHQYDDVTRSGIGWLLTNYSPQQGSWVPNPRRPNQREDYLGLTAQALHILYGAHAQAEFKNAVEQPHWTEARRAFLNKSVGQHLLGDNSHLSDMDGYVFPYPQPLEPMTFLWAPWSMAAYRDLANDNDLTASEKKLAEQSINAIAADYQEQAYEKIESGGTYELSENLLCISEAFPRNAH